MILLFMVADDLREICLNDIPLSFYKSMADGIDRVYKESEDMAHNTPVWDAEGATYIAPYLRLVVFERLLHESAKASGMIAVKKRNVSRNYPYTLARAKRLVLTASAVEGRNELPRRAVFRDQLSEMNAFLNAPTLPSLFGNAEVFNPTGLYAPKEVYGIILHGKSFVKTADGKRMTDSGRHGFLRLAFMNDEMTEYAANFDFFELYTQALARNDAQLAQIEDKAVPKLRTEKRKEKQN